MTREEAILWLQVLKHSQINWVGEQAEDEDIIAKCEEAEQEAFDLAIEALSADAVQGEWIDIDNYYRMATCSRCHKVTMFEKWGEYTKPYDFCPNCGARMTPYKGGDAE